MASALQSFTDSLKDLAGTGAAIYRDIQTGRAEVKAADRDANAEIRTEATKNNLVATDPVPSDVPWYSRPGVMIAGGAVAVVLLVAVLFRRK